MIDWLLLQNKQIIYLSLFVILVGSALGVPIPEDLPLIAAGIAVNNQLVEVIPTFLVCYISIILGDSIVYAIGYRLGTKLFEKSWFKSRVSAAHIRRTRMNLHRRSWLMIFLARHLFYLRTATFLVCGAVKMSFKRFILIDLCAAAISTPIMMSVGYLASEHWDKAREVFRHIEILALIPVVFVLYALVKKRKKPNRRAPQSLNGSAGE
jgi:membrane protein DedA with SNARE-associated domain